MPSQPQRLYIYIYRGEHLPGSKHKLYKNIIQTPKQTIILRKLAHTRTAPNETSLEFLVYESKPSDQWTSLIIHYQYQSITACFILLYFVLLQKSWHGFTLDGLLSFWAIVKFKAYFFFLNIFFYYST